MDCRLPNSRSSLALAVLLAACTSSSEAPPPRAGDVDVPRWAEGTPPPKSTKVATTTTPTSLGNDEPKRPAHGKKIDLDVVSADLPNVCRLIGELAGVNIVVSDGVTGNVTIKMRGVPWNEALDAILLSKGYHAEQVGSVIVIRK
jgi:hypothetical protein